MIALFNRQLFALTKYVAWIGMLFLLGAVGITTLDVLMRKLGFGGIFGAIDLIQLMVMTAAYLSIPFAFMSRSHVAVSILADMAPRRVAAMMQLLGAALGVCFMFAIAWFGYDQAVQQAEYGDLSMTFGLPMLYYWIPLLIGAALSTLVTLHIAVEALYTMITGRSGIVLEEFN